jgi:PAS domain S-box-containing protein
MSHPSDKPQNPPKYQLERFFELSIDLMCIAGFDGYFRKVNPGFVKLMGYTEEELMSKPINKYIHPDDVKITSEYRNNIHKGTPLQNFENRYITKSGEIVWLAWTSMPLESEQLVYAVAKNITHKKKLEDERNVMLTNLTIINNELKNLTYSTSHDLRSPVSNLIAAFSLLDITKVNDSETIEVLNLLKLASEGLNNTLNHYVDSLLENEPNLVEAETLDLEKTLDLVTFSLSSLIKNSQTTIEHDFSAAPQIRFNQSYLESVFLNLVTNSIKYAKPGRPPVIFIKTEPFEGNIKLTYTDNGIGFDLAKVKDKVFGFKQKFTENADSKGIGLYLVQSHIHSFGGSIVVDSVVDEGSTFTIIFKND